MTGLFSLLLPLILTGTALYAAGRRVDVYSTLCAGAASGLETMVRIFPALVGLMTAVSMFRSSGALELLSGALRPVMDRLGLPSELLPLMLVRPVSGSADPGGGLGADPDLRPRLPAGTDGGGDAGLHRDHLLHCGRLLRGRQNHPHPVRRPCRPVRRLCGVLGGGLGGEGAVLVWRGRFRRRGE